MTSREIAYSAGETDAKVAFLGELYEKNVKGNFGPIVGSLTTGFPSPYVGLASGAVQALNTPKDKSTILSALGVAGGTAATNSIVQATVPAILTATANALGLKADGRDLLRIVGNALGSQGVFYGGKAGRSITDRLDQFLKTKDVRIP